MELTDQKILAHVKVAPYVLELIEWLDRASIEDKATIVNALGHMLDNIEELLNAETVGLEDNEA